MTVKRTAAPKESSVSQGIFFTFEGGEGSGKSTQLKLLQARLEKAGVATLATREPGGSPGAEVIRYLLLSGVGKHFGADAEAMLFAAARDDHVHNVILPALARGTWVLCDRFTDSTAVYQGTLGNVDPSLLDALSRVTIGDLSPDVTFILDVPVEVGMARAAARRGKGEAADRFESEGLTYHMALREAYLQRAKDFPARCVVVPATGTEGEVAEIIWAEVLRRFSVPGTKKIKSHAG